jgi:hypothetical protein
MKKYTCYVYERNRKFWDRYLVLADNEILARTELPAVWMKKQTQALTAMMFSKSWNMNPGKEACYEYLSLLYQRCRHTV